MDSEYTYVLDRDYNHLPIKVVITEAMTGCPIPGPDARPVFERFLSLICVCFEDWMVAFPKKCEGFPPGKNTILHKAIFQVTFLPLIVCF